MAEILTLPWVQNLFKIADTGKSQNIVSKRYVNTAIENENHIASLSECPDLMAIADSYDEVIEPVIQQLIERGRV